MENGKLFYTIGEVAEELGESTTLVRFWTNRFKEFFANMKRGKNGARKYTCDDVELLKAIHYLVKDKGMTLEGAERRLAVERPGIDTNSRIKDKLLSIREKLVEISDAL